MKKIIFILFLLVTKNCLSAELLVKANQHWMDSLTQVEISKFSQQELDQYNARSQIGDIIVVRPDGWQWGKEEGLPKYVVVKVPGMTEVEMREYEKNLIDTTTPENSKLIRIRKYALPKTYISNIKTNFVTLSKTEMHNILVVKAGLVTEISAPIDSPIVYIWSKIKQPLMIAYHFWFKNAYAATQLLKTVKPSGGDYTSLEACMHANEQNLVTVDKYFDVEIDGTWSSADTTKVTIHNYTTDATRYINIYTTATARHNGKWKTDAYRIEITSIFPNPNTVVSVTSGYVTIKGLQVKLNGDLTNWQEGIAVNISATATATVAYCISWSTSSGAPIGGIKFLGGKITAYNNIIYGWNGDSSAGLLANNGSNAEAYMYNNTVYNCGNGMLHNNFTATVITAKNNILYNNVTEDWRIYNFPGTLTTANNLTKDATSPDVAYRSKTLTFVNITAGSEDLHLVSGDTDAIDDGVDLSATFTDDIDGVTRSGTWDIGADEFVAAGGAYIYPDRDIGRGIMRGIMR